MSSRTTANGFLSRHHQRRLNRVGARNPDRIGFHEIATGHETIGQMRERGFVVCARCPLCRRMALVDLDALVAILGRDLSLWNRHPRCKTMEDDTRCKGRVTFVAKARAVMRGWEPLADPPRTPDVRDAVSGRPEPPLPQGAS